MFKALLTKRAILDQTTDWEQSVSLLINELGVSSFPVQGREQAPGVKPEAQRCNTSQRFSTLEVYEHTQRVGLVCGAGERRATRRNMPRVAPSAKGGTAQRTAASSLPPPAL